MSRKKRKKKNSGGKGLMAQLLHGSLAHLSVGGLAVDGRGAGAHGANGPQIVTLDVGADWWRASASDGNRSINKPMPLLLGLWHWISMLYTDWFYDLKYGQINLIYLSIYLSIYL